MSYKAKLWISLVFVKEGRELQLEEMLWLAAGVLKDACASLYLPSLSAYVHACLYDRVY